MKFRVTIPLNASYTVDVEAETEEEAIDKSVDSDVPQLCHHCAKEVDLGDPSDEGVTAEEI